MIRRSLAMVALAAALGASNTHAFQIQQVSAQCSDSLVAEAGEAFVWRCTGDLVIDGLDPTARIESTEAIRLEATGRLHLGALELVSPFISLSGQTIELSADLHLTNTPAATGGSVALPPPEVTLQAGGRLISPDFRDDVIGPAGAVVLSPGRDVTLSAVPEPSSWALMLMGGATLAWCTRRRA